jgi:hypothetical protein
VTFRILRTLLEDHIDSFRDSVARLVRDVLQKETFINHARRDEPTAQLIPAVSSVRDARGFVESRPQTLCQLQCVVVRPEMHEEQPGLLPDHVAV